MGLTPQQVTGKKLGAYELVKEVSASSVGTTLLAKSDTTVLLTKIHRHVAKSAQLVENLLTVAKKAAKLDGPHILRVVDNGVIENEPFVAYAYDEQGETIASLVRRAGPEGLPLGIALRIVLDVLEGLETAYMQNPDLGHGELGPWCMHLGPDGLTRVSGIGVDRAIARFGLHHVKNLERLTFAAPERVKAMSLTLGPPPPEPDAKSDTFSVGVLAWELIARQRLFSSRMEAAIIQKVLTGPIPDLAAQRSEVPSSVVETVTAALSREPAERPNLSLFVATVGDGDVSTHAEVAEFASQLVDKSQSRAVGGAPRAFMSVRPIAPTAKNGATPPSPPAAARPKTILGLQKDPAPPKAPIAKTPSPAPAAVANAPAAAAPAGAAASAIEEPTTTDEDLLVDDEPTHVAEEPAKAAPPPPPKGRSVAPPMPRRAPPKPRQQTLLGVEPLGPPAADAKAADAKAADAKAADAKAADAPEAPAPEAPAPEAPALDAAPVATSIGAAGQKSLDRLRTGAHLGKDPGYELLDAVARGGMATVWAARPVGDTSLDHLVAVKTMLPELSDDPDFESMFLDEMRVAAKIKHPNVAGILAVGEEDEVMYLVMEWVDGETIGAIQRASRADGGIPLPIVLRLAADICAGLHAAHETKDSSGNPLELVHRDVNPANVLVTRAGEAKVLDFGIAKSKGRLHVTRVGSTVKGKTPYLSPEQLGGLAIDRRSDLFSLGALLYVMATGLHPFRGDTELKTVENIALKSPAPLRTIVPDVHPEFEKLVLRLLEKQPAKRFATAAEVQKELERIETILAKPATTADVGAFVSKAIGETLLARHKSLIEALAKIAHDQAASALGALDQPLAVPLAPAAAEPRSPFDVDEATTLDLPPSALAAPAAEPLPANPFDEVSAAPSPLEVAAPIVDEETLADGVEHAAPLGALEPTGTPLEFEEEPVAAPPSRSPWMRLAVLVVVGVAVGIGIIATIEATREPAVAPVPTATPTQPPKPAATPAPTPEPVVTAAPAPTETATAEPSATAEPTEEPAASAAPSVEPTAPPVPTGPRPPATYRPKPRPKPYNPTTI